MSNDPARPEVSVRTRAKAQEQARTRRLPPYNVILENDDHHSAEFVVDVLRKVLGCTVERAHQLMEQAHSTGRSIVWTGPKEVAELKYEQITSFHEISNPGRVKLGPLGCSIEPAPG